MPRLPRVPLRRAARGEPTTPGPVPHAAYGALAAIENGVELAAPVIAGHHSGLPDMPTLKSLAADPDIRKTYEEKIQPAMNGLGLKREGPLPSGSAPDLRRASK
jgi:hypothetical protein